MLFILLILCFAASTESFTKILFVKSSHSNRCICFEKDKVNDSIFGSEFLFTKNRNKKAVKIETVIQKKDQLNNILDDEAYRQRMELKQKSLQSKLSYVFDINCNTETYPPT